MSTLASIYNGITLDSPGLKVIISSPLTTKSLMRFSIVKVAAFVPVLVIVMFSVFTCPGINVTEIWFLSIVKAAVVVIPPPPPHDGGVVVGVSATGVSPAE